MKRIIVSLLLLIGLLTVGCVNDDPIADQWTHNLYPDSGGNYSIGSSGNPYFEGHFTNLYFNNSVMTGNFSNVTVVDGGCVYIWDADNSDYFSLCHDGGVGIIWNPTGDVYVRAAHNVVADLTGDSAGMYEFQVENSGNAEVASIDTAGNLDIIGNASIGLNASADYFIGDGSQLTGIEQGELILYFLNDSSPDVAGVKRLSSNYNSSTQVLSASGLAAGNTLMGTWITDAGVPAKNLLTGNIRVHVTGRQTAGTKISQYFFEIWKCNSSGSNLVKIATSEYSNPLTAVNVTYRIWTLADEVELNTSDRIKIIGYAYVSGGGSAPTIEAQIQGPSFTRLVLPVGAVSIEKFVPYDNAVQEVTIGTAIWRLDGSFAPASMSNSSAVNNSIYFSTDNNKLCYRDSLGVIYELY
jgi:protocatechuate 3,4-dioxygenase beta subunit